jgi:hypothetical protein
MSGSGPSDSDEGIDEVRWRILCEAVIAAHRGDPAGTKAATARFETEVEVDGQATGYLWYLIRYRITDYLGRKPTEQDLQRLARRRYPRFAAVSIYDEQVLEDMLRSLFNMIPEDRRITGGMFVVLGIMTLGILLDQPEVELAEMKPHLAEWWRRRGRQIVQEEDEERRRSGRGR